uniref:Macaca fascicularis brain cDNA clone: QflA-18233, similar to human nuclear receptor coactivator 4 (NCOA4), mRNA, RefSeq: NM_005437.1 n=1 Tax=Macaca fascicularis TaxID=9541 RepID=I7GLG5_MACFA|nr:unnamed protein product [Macaca fascicularis]
MFSLRYLCCFPYFETIKLLNCLLLEILLGKLHGPTMSLPYSFTRVL